MKLEHGQHIIFKHPNTGEIIGGKAWGNSILFHVDGYPTMLHQNEVFEFLDAKEAWQIFNEQYPTYFDLKKR